MARVLILSGIQISANPRVVKEASALAAGGFDVEVVGASLNPALVARDNEITAGQAWKYKPLVSLSEPGLAGRSRAILARLRRRAWIDAGKFLGVSDLRQFGYSGPEMLAYALRNPADLVIVHLPMAFWIGVELIERGHLVAADFEDWYSEDYPPGSAPQYAIKALRRVERFILERAVFATATSLVMSQALARSYSSREPSVVYNSFPESERATLDGVARDRVNPALPSLHWFSQVVGPGRGLELLMQSLSLLEIVFEIHLRGRVAISYRNSLLALAPAEWRRFIHFHDPVPHHELLSRIQEHDLSLASEQSETMSRRLTITNKAMHSLLAGVPVIASDTEGQRELASNAGGAVFLYDDSTPGKLAALLASLFTDPELLKASREEALRAATSVFSWNHGTRTIVRLVNSAITGTEAE